MPRRNSPDPVAQAIGARIRELRAEKGLTSEKLAYGSDVGSKGYLSDIEAGLAMPSLSTLLKLAQHLEVELVDLLCSPAVGLRHQLIDATRDKSVAELRAALAALTGAPPDTLT